MSAVVIALNTPYYAMSNGRGEISLSGVAPGRYQMHVFHPLVSPEELHAVEREITVTPGDTFVGTFTLSESEPRSRSQEQIWPRLRSSGS